MSVKEILQNIHYFFGTILPNAYLDQNCDSEWLNCAFYWAEYCEKIYESSVNQPYAHVLDNHIQAIGSSLGKGISSLCLEYLHSSSKSLLKALVQNVYLSKSLYDIVLKKASDKGCLEEVLQSATETKSLFITLIRSLYAETSSSTDADSFFCRMKTELFMNDIKESFIHSSSTEKTEQFLSAYLDSIFSDSQKMKEYLLLSMKPSDEFESTKKLQEIFINELLKRVNRKSCLYQHSVAFNLWNQPASLLSCMAARYLLFFKSYMDFLLETAHTFEADYNGGSVAWHSVSMECGVQIEFPALLLHFKCLMNINKKVSAATRICILSQANTEEEKSAIWLDICDCLHIS